MPSPSQLAERARALLPIVRRQARRPFIVELAGTPKAGKSTALEVLRGFFKQCGYQVEVMRERAEDCPIVMKGHFFFNTWTTTTMIASMIEKLDTEADVLLLDRGVFDSVVWLEKQRRAHQITPEENEIFRKFALLDRWRSLTDLTCVLTVSAERAMEREQQARLVPRKGSIVSGGFLAEYNEVLADVQRELADQFHFVDVDTTAFTSTRQTNLELAGILLDHLRRWVDPEIFAIPRALAEELFGQQPVRPLAGTLEAIERSLVSRPRSVLEVDDAYVQLVAAAVLRHEGQVLLLRRDAPHDPKRATFGRDVLWKGCHVPSAGSEPGALLAMAQAAITGRLKEDFHLAALGSAPVPRWMAWTRSDDNPNEGRHLGIVFELEVSSGQSLTGKVFKRDRTGTRDKLHELVEPAQLQARMSDPADLQLEPWSQQLLHHMVESKA